MYGGRDRKELNAQHSLSIPLLPRPPPPLLNPLIQPLPSPLPSLPPLFFYPFLFFLIIVRHLDTFQCMRILIKLVVVLGRPVLSTIRIQLRIHSCRVYLFPPSRNVFYPRYPHYPHCCPGWGCRCLSQHADEA